MPGFNNQIKQILILSMLIALILIAITQLHIFLPGLLGALTLYILSRGSYFQLIYHRKWRKGWTAGFFVLSYFLILCLIIYVTVVLLGPKIEQLFINPTLILSKFNDAISEVQRKSGITFMAEDTLSDLVKRISGFIPTLLNTTGELLINLAILLFMLYYMLVHGKEMEKYLDHIIPLKHSNIQMLASSEPGVA